MRQINIRAVAFLYSPFGNGSETVRGLCPPRCPPPREDIQITRWTRIGDERLKDPHHFQITVSSRRGTGREGWPPSRHRLLGEDGHPRLCY